MTSLFYSDFKDASGGHLAAKLKYFLVGTRVLTCLAEIAFQWRSEVKQIYDQAIRSGI